MPFNANCPGCGSDPCGCNSTKSIPSSNIKYVGPNLPGTGIQSCDTLTVALQKIDAEILAIKQAIAPTSTTTSSSTTTTTTTIPVPLSFKLTFNDISSADLLVGDSSDVNDWNTFFNLPTLGTAFTSVQINNDEVWLFGGDNIKVKPGLFYLVGGPFNPYQSLISIDDQINCITSVGGDAFSYCDGLIDVSLPACTIVYSFSDSPYADMGGFGECDNLTTVNLPNLVTAGTFAFYYCTSLQVIDFPQLTSTGTGSFFNCSSATSLNLPLLTTVGGGCFGYCSSLTTLSTINIPSVTVLPSNCFQVCSSLVSVDLPLVTTVDVNCFRQSSSLTTVEFAQATSIGQNSFDNCYSLTTIEIPSCTSLGGTVGNNNVFLGIITNTITLTVPSALMTVNSGNPDGDIQYLQANNTVTVVTV